MKNKNHNKKLYALIIWYIIFIILIPLILHTEKNLMIYLPIVDMIANVFSSSGRLDNKIFKDIYNLSPNNITSFISTNFINLVALTGVAMVGTSFLIKTGNRIGSIYIMLVMYTITYLLPTQGLNWIVIKIQRSIDNFRFDNSTTGYINKIKKFMQRHSILFDYLGGVIVVILLLLFETFLINNYIKYLNISL